MKGSKFGHVRGTPAMLVQQDPAIRVFALSPLPARPHLWREVQAGPPPPARAGREAGRPRLPDRRRRVHRPGLGRGRGPGRRDGRGLGARDPGAGRDRPASGVGCRPGRAPRGRARERGLRPAQGAADRPGKLTRPGRKA